MFFIRIITSLLSWSFVYCETVPQSWQIIKFSKTIFKKEDIMNRIQISLQDTDFISFEHIPRIWFLDHIVVPILFLIFWGTAILFSIAVHCFTFTPIMHKCSPHSYQNVTFYFLFCFALFYNSHPKGREVISHYGFGLHFSDD